MNKNNMKKELLETSNKFWKAIKEADVKTMRDIANNNCTFVHIGGNCNLDKEMELFENGTFKPTKIDIHNQTCNEFNDTGVVITDCDYSLLLGGKETTHHFAVTEVYTNINDKLSLVQFTFTALVI